ncbi:hypothetical protein [Azospirillum brasilense]|uniref:hypothetical protein n=1 Tax=Azospirillum brasilense TaxID=192 RepID=UPI001ED9CBCF|nr:hypothetical protein [Azospirillum brasilense]UKJ74446.1 hypothetical protein H1Q64_17930 [Azospirillum brasilense]
MPSQIKPFASEAESLQVDELTVENQTDRVSIYGSLIVTKDKKGLQHARELKAILDDVVAALEDEQGLPDQVATKPTDKVEDPWG